MNGGIDGSYLALAGRVPVKVVGDVQPGDMLVASDTPGHAQTNNKEVYANLVCERKVGVIIFCLHVVLSMAVFTWLAT